MSQPVIVERTFDAPVVKVWKAITTKEQISQWLFPMDYFECKSGFEFRFTGSKDDVSYSHLCKITEVVPLKKLSFSWRYDGFSGNSFVTFELFSEGKNKTLLRLTHMGLDTLPPSNPNFLNGNYVPNWPHHIELITIDTDYHENNYHEN